MCSDFPNNEFCDIFLKKGKNKTNDICIEIVKELEAPLAT